MTLSGGTWSTSVNELIGLFQLALVQLVPVAEKARIPWRDAAAYDDWDDIADTLFRRIVVESIRWSLPSGAEQDLKFAAYDYATTGYRDVAFIEVDVLEDIGNSLWAFKALRTKSAPFDTVEIIELDRTDRDVTGRTAMIELTDAKFYCRLPASVSSGERLGQLLVSL